MGPLLTQVTSMHITGLPRAFGARNDNKYALLYSNFLVPKAGLEPAQLAPPPPQDGVSTNFTTSASKLDHITGPGKGWAQRFKGGNRNSPFKNPHREMGT